MFSPEDRWKKIWRECKKVSFFFLRTINTVSVNSSILDKLNKKITKPVVPLEYSKEEKLLIKL